MKHEIIDSPDFGLLKVSFENNGEQVVAESGAMVAMSAGLNMKTAMRGGLMAAAKRKLLGGESLFQNTFTAKEAGQELYLAPAPEGDLAGRTLAAGEEFFLQSGAYVAHMGEELTLDTKWGGVKSFFGGTGLFLLKLTGPGTVFYSSYGALHEIEVGPDGYTCDNDHVVGFTSGLDFNVTKFGGIKSFFFSGEGLVCTFRGSGTVILQTRNAPGLASFLEPYRPTKKSN